MPVQKCTRDGKDGFKWGEEGTYYIGTSAKADAEKQGRAIEISKLRKKFTKKA